MISQEGCSPDRLKMGALADLYRNKIMLDHIDIYPITNCPEINNSHCDIQPDRCGFFFSPDADSDVWHSEIPITDGIGQYIQNNQTTLKTITI